MGHLQPSVPLSCGQERPSQYQTMLASKCSNKPCKPRFRNASARFQSRFLPRQQKRAGGRSGSCTGSRLSQKQFGGWIRFHRRPGITKLSTLHTMMCRKISCMDILSEMAGPVKPTLSPMLRLLLPPQFMVSSAAAYSPLASFFISSFLCHCLWSAHRWLK